VTNTDAMVGPAKKPVRLRDRSAAGFLWFLLQSAGSKGATLLGQIVLAWLLLPEDFGLVGLAYTVTAFTSLIQKFGVREVLNRRRRRFHLWAGPAQGLSIVSGCLGGAAAAAGAPLAAWVYDEPRVVGLILVLALSSPFWSAATVPLTRLEVNLRFRTIATVHFSATVGTVVCSVLLAALGFGAYAFVLPRLVVGAAQLAALWRVAPVPMRGALRVRRWRGLIGDSVFVFFSHLFRTAFSQGDYFILGLTAARSVVGLYYFAFSLSMQTALLFSQNLAKVLLPSLASLQHNPKRQVEAALEAVGLLAFVTTPVCLLQAVLAEPALRLLFAERWTGAIPLLQILSVGMALTTASWPINNLFDAQGRFRSRMWFMAGAAGVFFLLVAPAAQRYGVIGVAVAVVAHRALFAPAQLIVAMRGVRPGLRAFARVNGRPLLAAGIAAAAAFACNAALPDGVAWDLARLVVGALVLGVVYAAIAWPLMPDCRRMLRERIVALAASLRRRAAPAPV